MILENINKKVDLKPLNTSLNSLQADYFVEIDTNANPQSTAEICRIHKQIDRYMCVYKRKERKIIMGMI